jgi:hypothetical protein
MDKRALKILFDAFWSPAGWKSDAVRGPSIGDFEYAKSLGLMFDPVTLDHEQLQNDLNNSIRQLDRRRVADAFLSSLSTRRLDWRSAFGSYVVFQHMPSHSELAVGGHCAICRMYLIHKEKDLNVFNFERFKWGGIRHAQVEYAAFDLRQFIQEPSTHPIADDVRIFRDVIESIRAAPVGTTSAALQAHLPKSLKSNKAERDVLVALLGYCGVLGTPDHPGYSDAYVPYSDRRLPSRRFIDMSYPACWWDASIGLNETKLEEHFGYVL